MAPLGILSPASFDNPTNQNNNINISSNGSKPKNKTLKNNERTAKIKHETVQQDIIDPDENDSESNDLANFDPSIDQTSVAPILELGQWQNSTQSSEENKEQPQTKDDKVTQEGFNQLKSAYANDYYKQFVSYPGSYVAPSQPADSNYELLKKLDNILYLLEEQHEEKLGYITEELILYVFLGVFIIFILDSFVRVGKYTR